MNRQKSLRGLFERIYSIFLIRVLTSMSAKFVQYNQEANYNSAHGDLYALLQRSSMEIYSSGKETTCFYHNTQPKKDKDLYLTTTTGQDLNFNATFIYNVFCPDAGQLGNHIGAYFNEFACAMESGAHFSIYQKISGDMPLSHKAFFSALPSIVLNSHHNIAGQRHDIKHRIESACPCHEFCWTKVDAPWLHHIDWMVDAIRTGTTAFVSAYGPQNLIPAVTKAKVSLPAIPDVAIHYRCGDNLTAFIHGYGVLPFAAILRLIPSSARFIYVFTNDNVKHHHCGSIMKRIVKYLSKNLKKKNLSAPDGSAAAPVVVKLFRDGDPLVAFTRLLYANTLICSSSTFCFYAALANNGTAVHFPRTHLIARPSSSDVYGSRFHWIEEDQIMDAWSQDTSKLLTKLEESNTKDNDSNEREREDLRL